MSRHRQERPVTATVTVSHVENAVCQDRHFCTLALPFREELGKRYGDLARDTCQVDYDDGDLSDPDTDDAITVAFDFIDPHDDRVRHSTGTIEPKNIARKLLFGTDTNKAGLLKQIRSAPDAFQFTLTHESRFKQNYARTPVGRDPITYARDKGYQHGRSADPEASRVKFQLSEEWLAFTVEQQDVYESRFVMGKEKGPLVRKRKPRRSAGGGRVYVGQPEDA